ncbi:DNA-directed RNA polymerase [Balamuthia mandrillaris]
MSGSLLRGNGLFCERTNPHRSLLLLRTLRPQQALCTSSFPWGGASPKLAPSSAMPAALLRPNALHEESEHEGGNENAFFSDGHAYLRQNGNNGQHHHQNGHMPHLNGRNGVTNDWSFNKILNHEAKITQLKEDLLRVKEADLPYKSFPSTAEASRTSAEMEEIKLWPTVSFSGVVGADPEAERELHEAIQQGKTFYDLSPMWKERLYHIQKETELHNVDREIRRFSKFLSLDKPLHLGGDVQGGKLMRHWFTPLRNAIAEEQDKLRNGTSKAKGRLVFGPFLLLLPPEHLALLTVNSVLSAMLANADNPEKINVPVTGLCTNLGTTIQLEVARMRLTQETDWKPPKQLQGSKAMSNIHRHAKSSLEDTEWEPSIRTQIGAFLLQCLLETATIPAAKPPSETDPKSWRASLFSVYKQFEGMRSWPVDGQDAPMEKAFGYKLARRGVQNVGVLEPNPGIWDILETSDLARALYEYRNLPMLVPPRDWRQPGGGAYLSNPAQVFIMRTKGSKQQSRVLFNASLDSVYQGLNALGSTPWCINQSVFEVIDEAWRKGGDVADIPSRHNEILPPPPDDWETNKDSMDSYAKLRRRILRDNANLHSLRCDTTLKLQVARDFLDKVFYFPHNLDFRGRTYPIPPHLNHVGQDLCRGLLTFAQKKPLGNDGLKWLKIHISNVYGNDKVPFHAREAFTEEHIQDIIDSAENPLGGKRWWVAADKPWQCLAACIEFTNAMRYPEGATAYPCSLPIHQDGSCNGLQHYAALGGDELGAKQVNLSPSDGPQDVYSGVLELVKQRIEADVAKGDNEIAKRLHGMVDRKVIKQTVMTSVYGVTQIGARQQIENALKDKKFLSDDELFACSRYLTVLTFASLKEMFSNAKSIMTWLGDCARTVAREGDPVRWTTPLGLPVVQPYRKISAKKRVYTVLQVMMLTDDLESLPVSVQKQRTAFPPNYVHSLDSTHMIMTALACNKAGLTFASVHDSFWTHPCTVDEMSLLLREKFVELHSQPLLENLLDELKRNHPKASFPPLPSRGAFDLHKVLESKYFFQ